MTLLDEIAKKESETLEFKAELPDDSLVFVKTMIAFSNGTGGLLVIGIKEGTHEPMGVSEDDQQDIEERITNAAASMCEPQMVPVFSWTKYKEKNVLIVTIRAGTEKPYHVKGKARSEGTYIRIGPTTHLAKQAQIDELKQFGKVPFDKQRNYETRMTDGATKKLCDDLSEYGKRKFTKKDLLSLQVIKEDAGTEYPTNAYALLTGDISMGLYHIIECAAFRGKEKGVFIDRATFREPIHEQIENAHRFVIKNIKVGQWLPGGTIAMQNIYEVPSEAIRESIANAVTHRNYNVDNSNIYVAVFDDRIEIISPGILPPDTTMSNALSGISTPRNHTLASVFKSAGVTEGWGTGIRKIIKECRMCGLRDPTFEQRSPQQFVVTLYRSDKFDPEVWYRRMKESEAKESLPMNADIPTKVPNGLTDEEKAVYNAILSGNGDSLKDLETFTGFSRAAVKRVLLGLKGKDVAGREGNKRNGRYVIITKNG
ncbi:MAG: putative DNA binding domain-containing protein [Methanomassiliicoccaceae archaeon]|nr:putative DNA binding domain-containing protein [Methanomassiliicoccaceae archaeon]